MIPEAGQRFGPYEILGRLGGGGMGLVFRAWDERLHREVAVKLLHDDYKMPAMRERFLQEARAASALNHPNICTIFDIGEQNGDPYLVMELLEGDTLRDRIAHGALSTEEILRYTEEIADALTVAHAKGIVHRDIKPANIFLVAMANGKSQAKVLDFGLAKIELEARGGWESRTLDLTLVGATVGTLAYMSPEQARGESLDLRTDLFSLGVVMYEMATRRVPFQGTTSALMFVQLFSHTPEPVRNWNESIPRELERAILKLLAKDRRGRFQTAKELHDALAKIDRKPSRGGWLNRRTASAVPLVRADDPVARHRGKRQKPERAQEESRGEGLPKVAGMASESSADNMLIRPRRIPMPDGGGDRSVTRPAALVSREIPTAERAVPGVIPQVAAQSDSSAAAADLRAAQRAEKAALDARRTEGRESVLARSRSGVTQFEYDVDDIGLQQPKRETARVEVLARASEEHANTRIRVGVAAALIVMIAVGVFLLEHSGFFRPMVLGTSDRLLMTVIQNKTGDKTLDGVAMQGLEIALGQSASLHVLGGEAYRAGLRQVGMESGDAAGALTGQKVAQKVGAKAYLYGEIRGMEPPYVISVDVLKTDSNDKAASLEEAAESRGEIPAAISRLAQLVRAEVSEDSNAEVKKSVSLEQEATGNLEALHAYAMGKDAMQSGRPADALMEYQRAASLDPKFVQAQMRLAWMYRSEKAEVAAAHAAEMASAAAVHASDKVKLLAQFCYEMNASGDYGKAVQTIRGYVARYPRDVDGMKGLARVLGVEGHLPESLLAAQQGYDENPFEAEAYAEAELAMIGMDRFDSVLQLEDQAKHLGVLRSGNALTAGYLGGKDDIAVEQVHAIQAGVAGNAAQLTYAELMGYGLYLDGTGKTGTGLELWRTVAARASRAPEFVSTQASMLAQGALDRALVESCAVALEIVNEVKGLPKGPVASFNAGMAAALCGDQTYADKVVAGLKQDFPRNTAVNQYYVPELQVAAALGVNEPARALQELNAFGQPDQAPLIPYLRGMAHAAVGQMPAAINDFQNVLARRGADAMEGSTLYPMAEIGEARAYGASGDKVASAAAYRRFLVLWKEGDRGQPMMTTALAKGR